MERKPSRPGPRKPAAPGRAPRPAGRRSGAGQREVSGGSGSRGGSAPSERTPRRPVGPAIPDDVDLAVLDRTVLQELRTLPEELAQRIAGHLAMVQRSIAEGDLQSAAAHAEAARVRAARVPIVRETAGVIAYLQGDYRQALAQLRAARRMTGSLELVPMIADCERGLGRPQECLDLVRAIDLSKVDPQTKVELLLVAAGARADMGQLDAAIVTLQIPELNILPAGSVRARLQLGYAEFLLAAGRIDEGSRWLVRAAASDVDGTTLAAERADELLGYRFLEDEDDSAK